MKLKEQYLDVLKKLFREWYGSLSVEELISNTELIKVIERIEQRLSYATT